MGLRVGIDGRYLQDHFPGVGRYTFHLIRELSALDGSETYVVFNHPSATNSRFDLNALQSERISFWPVDVPPLSIRSQAVLPLAIRRANVDIFHSPHYPLPLLASRPLLSTIHDTIPLSDPAYMPSGRSRAVYRLAILYSLVRSKAVIADSTASREDLLRHVRVTPYKIRTIYLGVDMPEPDRDPIAPKKCILYIGTNKPHKNLPRLVGAYARANPGLPLVIAGGLDPRYPEAMQRIESLGLTGRVCLLGHVGEDRLKHLYRSAALFVFPSLVEGFGLPVLEAMSYGVPVVTSNHPAISEVVGDAALQVNPIDEEALSVAIARVLSDEDLAQELHRKGHARAALFPWRRTADGCLRLYRETAGGG